MKVKARRISKNSAGKCCLPSKGYPTDEEIEIELADYKEVEPYQGDLPENDLVWPQGACCEGLLKVGNKIYEKIPVAGK